MTQPIRLAHIAYKTRRFDEMIDWYKQVFEAEVQHQNPALAFLTFDDEHHRFAFLNLDVIDPVSEKKKICTDDGLDHVAYSYADLGALLNTYARLKNQNISPYFPVNHGVTLSLYYKDPDGNRLELQVDCFASAEEGAAYMQGEAFASNSIGVGFDPDVLLGQYQSGVAVEKLLALPDGPPASIPAEHGIGA